MLVSGVENIYIGMYIDCEMGVMGGLEKKNDMIILVVFIVSRLTGVRVEVWR